MFFIKNIINGNFSVKYSKYYNSFIAINNKDKTCKYTPIRFYNNKDEINLLLQTYNIGYCFNILVRKKLKSLTTNKYKVPYKIIYDSVKDIQTKKDKSKYTYLLYDIYKNLIINFKLNDSNTIQPPYHFNNKNNYTGDCLIDFIDESKNEVYINTLIETILTILSNKKGTAIEFNSSNIVPFIFNFDISKYIFSDFNGVRKEYRDFLRALEKLCNKSGIPTMINLTKSNIKEKVILPNNKQINLTVSKYSNDLEKLNSTYCNKIYPKYDSIEINSIEINLNDFIIECYYIFHLLEMSNTLLDNKFIVKDDRFNYIQDNLARIFNFYYKDYDHPYNLKYIMKELYNQINLFKQNTLNNLKCNNIKIENDVNIIAINLKNETNDYSLELESYSSISSAIIYLLYDKYFNKTILTQYINRCHHCKTSKSKLHTLKFKDNIYKINIYLCDNCFKDWSDKCNNNRVKKFNNTKDF